MGELAAEHFTELMGTPVARAHSLDLNTLNLPPIELERPETPFSEEEIWDVIKHLPPDKEPVPDGFSARFY